MRVLLLVAVLAGCCSLHVVTGRSSGPPLSPSSDADLVCREMTPNPTNHGAAQSDNGGYALEISPEMATVANGFTYEIDTVYTIRLVGNGVINGFLVQARMPGNIPGDGVTPMLLGSFQPDSASGQQTLECDLDAGAADEATIAHSQRQNDATSVQFTWTAPSTAGSVDFFYTVVRTRLMHYDAISASQVGVTTPAPTTMPPPTTMTPPPNLPTGMPTAPIRSPDEYRFVRSHPEGCSRANCNVFIGIDTNAGDNGFLDIYMEGTAEGWVAVGFSETPDMFSADVVACNRVGDDIVAIDGWNLPTPSRGNSRDTIQDVVLHASNYDAASMRLSCNVSKRIALNGEGEDLDLSNDLYVLYARRITATTDLNSLTGHAVDPAVPSTRAASTVRYAITTASTSVLPASAAPVRAPDDYRLQVLSPDGCSPANCDLFIGIDTNANNDAILDIYLEGNADGWLAVGFSDTPNMFGADVVTCVRDSANDVISAWDTWNPQSRTNNIDTVQDVGLFNSSFVNGRISCTVSKRIAASNSEDLNLSDFLYVISARRTTDNAVANSITTHAGGNGARDFSSGRFSPSTSRGVIGASVHTGNLIRAHGIFMIIAWPLLACTAIFFAIFLRPALPNGEWFQVHRALMLISLCVTIIGVILIFVGLMGPVDTSSNLNLAHMIIGLVIVAFQIANPLIALLRCKPGDKKRWIFNMIHGHMIGFWSQTLVFINCSFGLSIFTRDRSTTFSNQTPLWVFIAWLVFQVLVVIIGAIFFYAYGRKTGQNCCGNCDSTNKGVISDKNSQAMEMKSSGYSDKEEKPERKTPSKDAPLRWAWFIFYITVTVPMLLAVIVMIAFP